MPDMLTLEPKSAATTNRGEWPLPPYFSSPDAMIKSDDEIVRIQLREDRSEIATLADFDVRSRNLTVRQSGKERTIAWEAIRSVELLRPVTLQLDGVIVDAQGATVQASDKPRVFAVEFFDTRLMSGDTIGFTRDLGGLFLFTPLGNGTVERRFIPDDAILEFGIGDLTGNLLVQSSAAAAEEVDRALEIQSQIRQRRLGDYLLEDRLVTREQIEQALVHQSSAPIPRLGDALVDMGLITPGQLQDALARQRDQRSVPLGQILVAMGATSEADVKEALAKKLGIPFVSLPRFVPEPAAVRALPRALARRFQVLPLYKTQRDLVTALEDPMRHDVIHELRVASGLQIVPVIATREDLHAAVERYYGAGAEAALALAEEAAQNTRESDDYQMHGGKVSDLDDLASRLIEESSDMSLVSETEEAVSDGDNTLVQTVNKILLDAWSLGASDIHIESYPRREATRIRLRRDGVMHDYLKVPPSYRNAIVSRIKIMASMDISERRKPQDGKLEFTLPGKRKIELRIATIPTSNQLEDVVLRVLSSTRALKLDDLGFERGMFDRLSQLVEKPHGLLLVCGPTGSGKTTTLHSLLGRINTAERKIWTAEDPIEITQTGLRQVQVNAKIGWTFAHALRSFLRADPDVIMVGEMRDEETARTGIEASLTGHLVLSTLHTNSAPESVTRLLDLGLDPFNFADALQGILAQRLVRRFCPHCRTSRIAPSSEIEDLARNYCHETDFDPEEVVAGWTTRFGTPEGIRLGTATGCFRCGKSGYSGRVGVYELLVNSQAIRRLIQARALVEQLAATARAEGMRTLRQDGIIKVLAGETDIQQVQSACN